MAGHCRPLETTFVGADDDHDPRPRALIAAALGCLNVAVDVWTAADDAIPLADLVDQAMGAVGG